MPCSAIRWCLEFAGDTPATTVKRLGAVSSVVERLVYTELSAIFFGLTSSLAIGAQRRFLQVKSLNRNAKPRYHKIS